MVTTLPEEPYCLMCGHRTAWSARPSTIGSSSDYSVPTPKITGKMGHRDANGSLGPRLPAKGWPTREALVGLSDGRRLGIRYVNLTRRQALCEGVDWQRGSSYLNARALTEVRRLFRNETGLNLVGLGVTA